MAITSYNSLPTEKELLHFEKRLKNTYFHSNEKGCNVIQDNKFEIEWGGKYRNRFFNKCETHNIDKICRCGWEIGKHYNYDDKKKI